MDKLIICETDRGRYAVRPISWAGIWNEKGQIQESLNHLALFIEKEDAENFAEWKEAEEQGKLLKLPCKAGQKVFLLRKDIKSVIDGEITSISISEFAIGIRIFIIDDNRYMDASFDKIGDIVFFTREEAEVALKELEGKGETD